jgi:hypothetical protein
MALVIRDARQMRALTGVSQTQFDFLLPVFSHVYQAAEHKRYEDGVKTGQRRRKPSAGIKGKLPTMADKLRWLFAIIEARAKSCHNRLKSVFACCVHFVTHRPFVGSASFCC